MKFETGRLGYAFEDDYPESYGPADRARLRAILPRQIQQLGPAGAAADERLLGILMGRRCGDARRAQIETRTRPDGSRCLVARGPEPTPPPPPPKNTRAAAAGPSTGSGGVVRVAVIDTGIPAQKRTDGWLDIPRTADNIDELDVLPAGPDGLLDYQAGHGTFVAGVIQRVAPRAEIRMYRAADTDGFATDNDIADAILRAHDDGAQIINLSMGIRTADDQPPPATADAVATVLRESSGRTVIVAAAGNFGDGSAVYPAVLDGVESVAGLTPDLEPAAWSSHGPGVRFSTVAEGIRSTFVGGTESPVFDPVPDAFERNAWAVWSGTSFAAPQIAGALARISYEEGVEPRAAADRIDEYGKAIAGYGKAMRILQGLG